MFNIEKKITNTAKKAGFLSGGLLLCSVGTGFLTVAGWLTLLPLVGTAATALIVACVYLGFGLILFAFGSTGKAEVPQPPAKEQDTSVDGPPILQAFLFGMQAGAKADSRKS